MPYSVPAAGQRVWRIFWRIDVRRTGNGFAATPISHSDIDAWCRRNRIDLRPWEYEALDEMEMARLEYLNRDTTGEPEVANKPLTPELFDAMF